MLQILRSWERLQDQLSKIFRPKLKNRHCRLSEEHILSLLLSFLLTVSNGSQNTIHLIKMNMKMSERSLLFYLATYFINAMFNNSISS
mmetsp:Transcript_19554/g.27548  ORF Transcript_19554/g.27548 Transcript_19554/m.27548 type:complete len:88 (+) Transcript_19554:281-544(+)